MKNYTFLTVFFLFLFLYSSAGSPNVLDEKKVTPKKPPLWEVKELLENPLMTIEENTRVRLVFSLTEERRLKIRRVQTRNEEIKNLISTKLQNQIIREKRIKEGTLYEVSIVLNGD